MGQIISRSKELINRSLQAVLPPKTYLDFLIWKRGFEEPEMKLLYEFCNKDSVSVDIGAANGSYLSHMYKLSKECYAFEPRKTAIENLIRTFRPITSNIRFENVALSDYSGTAKLRVLKENQRLSTIESTNDIERFGTVDFVNVQARRLDGYDFKDVVGFIKVDVEGHEEAVIEGAMGLIEKDMPVLLIEIEERHKRDSVMQIRKLLEPKGYLGYYYLNKQLNDIGSFSKEAHQDFGNPTKPYIFNFIYIHSSSTSKFTHLIA